MAFKNVTIYYSCMARLVAWRYVKLLLYRIEIHTFLCVHFKASTFHVIHPFVTTFTRWLLEYLHLNNIDIPLCVRISLLVCTGHSD